MYCGKCGAPNPPTSRFCAHCGAALTAPPASSPVARPVAPVTAPVTAPQQALTERLKPRIRTRIPSFVLSQLRPGEQVLAALSASLIDHHGTGLMHDKFLLTTDRLIYYRSAFIHKGMGEMPYRSITGVRYNRGLVHGKVVVEAANFGLTLSGISNDDAALAEKIIAGIISGVTYRAA